MRTLIELAGSQEKLGDLSGVSGVMISKGWG